MKIGILGMGTIGAGVYQIIQRRDDMDVVRGLDIRKWTDIITDRMSDILNDPEITTVVETMGGLTPAYEYAKAVLTSGKHYVTANKYLMSVHGLELYALARAHGVQLYFSAAVGGGIAYLRSLRAAKRYDHLQAVGGILNGTSNYILDRMQREGMDYATVLAEAQRLGYAERNPESDVEGKDTAQKLALACAVAFDRLPSQAQIPCAGIAHIAAVDIAYAQSRGRTIRLLSYGRTNGDTLCAYVEPAWVAPSMLESAIPLNVNCCWYEGEYGGRMNYTGQGAGQSPTAANIVGDLIELAHGGQGLLSDAVQPAVSVAGDAHPYYVRVAASEYDGALSPLIDHCQTQDGMVQIITYPVAVSDMHAIMKRYATAFFAGIVESNDGL